MAALQKIARFIALTTVALIAMNGSSAASTLVALDVDELALAADEVVVATVVSSQAEAVSGTIFTRYRVRVNTAVGGLSTPGDELEVIAAGGELNGIGVLVHGAPRLTVTERYLLFLRRHHSAHGVVGSAQGALPIREDVHTGDLLVDPPDDLPRLVRHDQGRLIPTAFALTGPTRLEHLLVRIREARHGL
jgi:hypothetical protein